MRWRAVMGSAEAVEVEDFPVLEFFPYGGASDLGGYGGGAPFAVGDVFAAGVEGGAAPEVGAGDFGVVAEVAGAVVALCGVEGVGEVGPSHAAHAVVAEGVGGAGLPGEGGGAGCGATFGDVAGAAGKGGSFVEVMAEGSGGFHVVEGGDDIPRDVCMGIDALVAGAVGEDAVCDAGDLGAVAGGGLRGFPAGFLDSKPCRRRLCGWAHGAAVGEGEAKGGEEGFHGSVGSGCRARYSASVTSLPPLARA